MPLQADINMDDSSFRRRSHRESNGGHSGYVPVDDEYLQHSGVRGKRGCCLCTLLVILLLVAVINALVTVGLVYFMSVTHVGMVSLEFLPGGRYLRALYDVHVGSMKINNGIIGGRFEKNLVIDGRKVLFNQSTDNFFSMDETSTVIQAKDFRIQTGKGKQLFSPTSQSVSPRLYEGVNLHASDMDIDSISSNSHVSGLHMKSYSNLDVLGMEGIQIRTAGDLHLKAPDMILTSLHGGIRMKSPEGVFLHPRLPVGSKDTKKKGVASQLKLCVCMPSGKLFTVPVIDENSGCHKASESVNPCDS